MTVKGAIGRIERAATVIKAHFAINGLTQLTRQLLSLRMIQRGW